MVPKPKRVEAIPVRAQTVKLVTMAAQKALPNVAPGYARDLSADPYKDCRDDGGRNKQADEKKDEGKSNQFHSTSLLPCTRRHAQRVFGRVGIEISYPHKTRGSMRHPLRQGLPVRQIRVWCRQGRRRDRAVTGRLRVRPTPFSRCLPHPSWTPGRAARSRSARLVPGRRRP